MGAANRDVQGPRLVSRYHAHRPRRSRAPGYLAIAILAVLAILAARPTYWQWPDGSSALCAGHTVIIGWVSDYSDPDHALCDY